MSAAPWGSLKLGRSVGRSAKRYNRRWWRLRSKDPAFRARHAASQGAWVKKKPANRRKMIRAARRWRLANLEYHRAQARKAYWTKRRKVCFFCGHAGKAGRHGTGALKLIERVVLSARGKWITRDVLCCRGCR
jgi:hypothetical protein